MRYLTYFITFLAYSCVHIMRMSIPFVQLKIMQHLTISKLEMGIANASLYIIIGISYFKLALFPIKQPQFTYLWSMIIAAVSFLCIPLLVYARIHTHWFLYLIMAGFGWFQTVAWPVLLTLVHTYFIPSRDGCMLGFWSANTSIGNIAGFALCTVLIYYLKFPFQVPLIVGGIMSIMTTISVYYLSPVESVQEDQQHLLKQQNIKDRCKDYKEIVATPIVLLMLVMLCMLKSILYGILLWLPMYFEKSGFSQYKGYIPIAMNVAAILGSIFLGLVYEKVNNKFMRALIVLTTLVLTVVIFYLIQHIQFTVQNRLILLLLISIIGFCVMGNFNILSTHETTTICEELNLQISAFSSLSMGFGSLFTGIVQIVIGFAATEDSNSIFVIFFVMSILLAVLEIVRAILFWRKNKSNQKVQAGHQNLEQ